MCSVRHSPIPSAPNWRALAASGPLSALARTASLPLRILSAHPRMILNSSGGSPSDRGTSPTTTVPLVPSMEMMSPSATRTSPTVKASLSMRTFSAPTTAGLPQPRATTAAWLTSPPRLVRIPSEAIMPPTSSGDVSARTRMTCSPRAAASAALTAEK